MEPFGVTWLQVSKYTAAHSNLFTSFAAPVLFLLLFNVLKKTILSYSKINCSVGILLFVPRLC